MKSHSKNEKMHLLTIKILQHLAYEQTMKMISCFLAVLAPQEKESRNMHVEEETEAMYEAWWGKWMAGLWMVGMVRNLTWVLG